jgi:hypothetical protein
MMAHVSSMMYIRCLGFASVVLLLVAGAWAQEFYYQLLHHWDYDQSAPLDVKQAGIEQRDGVTIMTFPSQVPSVNGAKLPGQTAARLPPSHWK